MNLLQRTISTLRTWLGLADPSDDHPTPSHGWLLPRPETLLKLRAQATPAPVKPPLR
jgi:hypothetical protein